MIPAAATVGVLVAVSAAISGQETAVAAATAPANDGNLGVAGPYLAAIHADAIGDVDAAARLFGEALSYDPDNADLLERAMTNRIAAGDVGEGIALAERLEKVSPSHHLGILALAAGDLKRDDPAAAAALLADNAPYVGKVVGAWAVYAEGRTGEAITMLDDLATSQDNGRPGQIVATYHLALMQAATGDDAAAVESFERAAEMSDGGTLRLVELQAGALARLGRTDEAVAVIRDRLADTYGSRPLSGLADRIADGAVPDPGVTTARQGAAAVLYDVSGLLARGQNERIALAYSQLAVWLSPEHTAARLLIAQIMQGSGQYDQAIAAYDAIPADSPEALASRIGKAQSLEDADRVEAALTVMRTAVERFPDALEAHTGLADMLRRDKQFEEASRAYSRAIALLGDDVGTQYWPLFYQRGITYERAGAWDKAEIDFKEALTLEPDQPDVLNYLGYSWVDRGEHLAKAEEMIRTAVEERPEDGYIVDSLGWVLFRFGEFQQAAEQLERAVALIPTDPVINDHYGDALWMTGHRTQARFQWKRALSFDPAEEDAERIRDKLGQGLDAVLAAEEAAGDPAVIGRATVTDEAPGVTPQHGG